MKPYLNIRDRILPGFDEGLLSIAFHPPMAAASVLLGGLHQQGWQSAGHPVPRIVYPCNHRRRGHGRSRADRATLTSSPNHYGGQLAFGKDGMLYLSTGDGGGNGDPLNKAQNKSSLRGKILRFRVVGRRGLVRSPLLRAGRQPVRGKHSWQWGLIWALGLRNPWRFSVDPSNRKPLDRRCRRAQPRGGRPDQGRRPRGEPRLVVPRGRPDLQRLALPLRHAISRAALHLRSRRRPLHRGRLRLSGPAVPQPSRRPLHRRRLHLRTDLPLVQRAPVLRGSPDQREQLR